MVEHHVLVVTEYVVRFTGTQDLDDFITEAVLEDCVTGTQQLVDVAHPLECERQRVGIAMDVRDNTEAHN